MPNLAFSDDGILCRGPTLDDANFVLTSQARDTVVEGEASDTETIDDSIFDKFTGATVDTGARLQTQTLVGPLQSPTFESLDEAVGIVDQDGVVTRVSDGTVRILVKGQWLTRRIDVAVSRAVGATASQFSNFAAGSLAKSMADAVDARLLDGKSVDIYTSLNHAAGEYVRNPNFFGAGLGNLSAVAPYSSGLVVRRSGSGTLITKKHCVTAWHWQCSVNDKIRWVTEDNTVVERTIADKHQLGQDICIHTLDQEVPDGLGIAKMLPADWRTKIGNPYGSTTDFGNTTYWTSKPPLLIFNQFAQAHVAELLDTIYYANVSQGVPYHAMVNSAPQNAGYIPWYGALIGGDSGQPCMMLIDGELVLAFCHFWGGPGSGPDLGYYHDAINTYISPYTVTTVDLSGFWDY